MTLFLYCVYELFTHSPGIEKHKLINLTPKQYDRIKYAEGSGPAHRICEKVFGEKPDLGWIESLEGEAVRESGGSPPFIETEVSCPQTKASQIAP